MNEEIITSCFQLITYVGTARSCFINAIQCAKEGGGSTKATKTMALMTLGVKGGDRVVVTVEGGSEIANLRAMEKFFKENL